MKRKNTSDLEGDIALEFDASKSYPNPFVERLGDLRNVVVLAPDVLKVFPDSTAVNEALRGLIALGQEAAAAAKVRRASYEVRTKKKGG
jgi:hypothetical protein